MGNYGEACFEKQRTIDKLQEEIRRLKEQLKYRKAREAEGFFKKVPEKLTLEYRASWVRHADETGWRKDGNNGYAWLFATDKISIFLFGRTRAASVARAILGEAPLPGYLVVDRYSGYNRVLCILQYCYAHLLRDVDKLEKDFPEDGEVKAFVAVLAPLLVLAIKLRKQPISDEEFSAQAKMVKAEIVAAVKLPAMHLGIRHIQDIFRMIGLCPHRRGLLS